MGKIWELFYIFEILFLSARFFMRLSITTGRSGLQNNDMSGTCYNPILHVRETGLMNYDPSIIM